MSAREDGPPPLIGITTYGRDKEDRFALPVEYVEAVRRAGGVPVLLPPGEASVDELIERLDGFVLSGGGDVDPALYGGDRGDPTLDGVDPLRDRTELAVLEAAALRRPTLAICRGLQLLNVWRGGTLWIDLARDAEPGVQHQPGMPRLVETSHRVTVDAGARVARWMSASGPIDVNSQHHQGVREVGAGLHVTARADDGTVEGLESDDGLMVGVQWHPEYLWPTDDHAARLLAGFVAACAPAQAEGGRRHDATEGLAL